MRLAFYAQSQLWSDRIALGIGERGYSPEGSNRVTHRAVLTLEPHGPGDYAEPTMQLNADEARELMDALWAAGVRPSNGTGNVGQLGATEKHLEDMRRLVFASAPSGRTDGPT